MVVSQYQPTRPRVHRGSAVIFGIILLQFKPSCLKGIYMSIWNHRRIQYILLNLYRTEIAEIVGVSQIAPGLVSLSPVYGANWDTICFLKNSQNLYRL